ncbi:hypothetical protein KIW84_UN0744 [Lathyrus oleraceus]|nr:hypothetical protein KIW84_UN0744 [Pisum sativum]
MCKCRSHGTFPLFGLQSSHLNIVLPQDCTDDRSAQLAPWVCSDRRALLLIRAWPLPQRPARSWAPYPSFRSSRIASSAYQNAHLELSIPGMAQQQPHRPTYLKFENRSRRCAPDASNHCFTLELALGLQLS